MTWDELQKLPDDQKLLANAKYLKARDKHFKGRTGYKMAELIKFRNRWVMELKREDLDK